MKYVLHKIIIVVSLCLFFTSGNAKSHEKKFFPVSTLENKVSCEKINVFTEKICLSLGITKPELSVFVVDKKRDEYNAVAGVLVKDSKKYGVALGALLLKKWEQGWLTDQEIEALLAHELCHVKNNHVVKSKRINKVVSYLRYVSGIVPVVPASCAIVQNAHNRQQEKEADLGAIGLIGDPLDLARAIVKVELLMEKDPATREQFDMLFATRFENIEKSRGKLTRDLVELFSDHPDTRKRIKYLVKHTVQKTAQASVPVK